MFLTYTLITLVMLGLVVTGMALGVIFSNKPLRGSCGGINAVMGTSGDCEFCGKKEQCTRRLKA